MTTRTTYNLLRRGITALALVCISVITFAENVAKIGETEYETLQAAIDEASSDASTTIQLINGFDAGTATYSISKTIILDLNGKTITASHNSDQSNLFEITSTGNLTVNGNGTINDVNVKGIFNNSGQLTIENGSFTTTSTAGYAVVFNTGSTAKCTVSGGTFTGAYAAVYNVSGATMTVSGGAFSAPNFGVVTRSGSTLNINAGSSTISSTNSTGAGINVVDASTTATISGGTITGHNGVFIMTNAKLIVNDGATITGSNASISGRGNDGEGGTTITINGGIITSTDDTGIYHPQVGTLTINDGTITGGKLGVEIRAGSLSVTGGTITATADTYSCVANTNGTTTVGAALAIAQHTTKQDIAVTISGGTFTGVKAISESNPQANDPAPQVTMEVTNGKFNGGLTVEDVQGGFIKGGTFNQAVPEGYCATGFIPKNNGDGTFGVKEGFYVAQIGETKYETIAEAIAAVADATEATIELIADVTEESITFPAAKNINLVGGAHTVSGTITSSGTLTIVSGTYTNTTENALKTEGSGTITINAGVFSKEPPTGMIAQTSEVMVGADNKYVVAAKGTAEAKMGNGEEATLYQTIALAITAASTNDTTITLLKDVAADEITIPENANITFEANGVTITKPINCNGTLKITNGIYQAAITATSPAVVNITGGTFQIKPTGYTCPDGKDLIINEAGVYVVTDVTLAEAKIDGNKYLTIDKAIEAAGETATTITLLKNPVAETITIPATADITLVINNVESTFEALTKPINVEGKLAITSGTISETTLTITDFNAVVKITAGVTHPAVALSSELQTENVLKSKAVGESAVTTYWAEKKFEATVALTGEPTTEQTTAANALVANTSIKEVSGHATNQSLTITVTSVTLGTESKVTKATFEVKLIGTDGEEVTGTVSAVTFRLPVSNGLNGKWANLWHDETAIPGMNVVGATNGYVTITTTTFSPFSYEIIETPIAQIGKTKYGSVADAITAAPDAEATEIILVGTETNVAEAITVGTNKNVKLTIGTHTLSGAITNAGTLAIADGTIEGTDMTITNTGALTISGGTISSPVTATAGTLAISGGTINNTITTSDAAGLNITGGTITGVLTVGGSGTNTISGGTISGAVTTKAATTISGGTFEVASSITNNCGEENTLVISGGTFNFTNAITNTSGTVAISGGTHTVLPVSGFCATGYMPIKNEAGKYEMTNHWTITDATVIDGSHFEYLTSAAGYKVETATYYRNTGMVSAGNAETMYGTICLPFEIKAAPTSMTLYKATSIADNTLTITAVTYEDPIAAGTPLIFELTAKASSMTVECSDVAGIAVNTEAPATAPITTSGSENLLVGTYSEKVLTSSTSPAVTNCYYLNGDHFHQALQSLTVPAFRAYIEYTSSSAPGRLAIVKADRVVTSLENAIDELNIVAVYDIQGRNIGRLQSGVNIVRLSNGQTIKIIKK